MRTRVPGLARRLLVDGAGVVSFPATKRACPENIFDWRGEKIRRVPFHPVSLLLPSEGCDEERTFNQPTAQLCSRFDNKRAYFGGAFTWLI